MWNKIKNKLIVKLMKNTRLTAHTCYAFVCKVEDSELTTYMRGYNADSRTNEEKFKFIFGVNKMGYMLTAVVRGTTIIETDTFEVETYKDLPDFVNSRMRIWEEKWNSPMELISLIYVY